MRTLLVQLNAIGDVVRATPVVEALRTRGDEVAVLTNESCLPVLAGLPLEALPNPRARIREALRLHRPSFEVVLDETADWLDGLAGRFDLVANLHGTAEAAAISGACRAPRRRGLVLWGREEADPWSEQRASAFAAGLPSPLDGTEVFALVAGVDPASCGAPRLALAAAEREAAAAALRALARPIVVLQASASSASRSLEAEEAAEVARALAAAHGASVVLSGAPEERRYLDAVARRAGAVAPWRPAGLREVAAALETADLVVTVDTWTSHAAAALGRPTLLLLKGSRVLPRGANPCLALVADGGADAARVARLAGRLLSGAPCAEVDAEDRGDLLARDGFGFRPLAPRAAPDEARAAMLGAAHLLGWEAFLRARDPAEPPSGLTPALAAERLVGRFDAASCAAAGAAAGEAADALRRFRDRLAGPDPEAALGAALRGLPPPLAAAVSIPGTALGRAAPPDAPGWLRNAAAELSAAIADAAEGLRRR